MPTGCDGFDFLSGERTSAGATEGEREGPVVAIAGARSPSCLKPTPFSTEDHPTKDTHKFKGRQGQRFVSPSRLLYPGGKAYQLPRPNLCPGARTRMRRNLPPGSPADLAILAGFSHAPAINQQILIIHSSTRAAPVGASRRGSPAPCAADSGDDRTRNAASPALLRYGSRRPSTMNRSATLLQSRSGLR